MCHMLIIKSHIIPNYYDARNFQYIICVRFNGIKTTFKHVTYSHVPAERLDKIPWNLHLFFVFFLRHSAFKYVFSISLLLNYCGKTVYCYFCKHSECGDNFVSGVLYWRWSLQIPICFLHVNLHVTWHLLTLPRRLPSLSDNLRFC